jgi:hypothetical protein
MSGDHGSKQVRGKALTTGKPPRQARKKAGPAPEELSPQRRAELAHKIEARRWRGKPPSI